jgi:cbb3-type cytochrome oxidase cytochrome c subunit
MEEQRRYLRQIEEERKGAYALLTQAMKAVAETARATNAATEKETTPRAQTNMAFEKNRQALAELDAVIAFLRANFLCWQSAWQRYMDTRETERNLSKELVEPRY